MIQNDVFDILDRLSNLNKVFDNKKIIIFGAGILGKATSIALNLLSIKEYIFVDNDRPNGAQHIWALLLRTLL